jgi:hypothetical protein
MTVRVLLAKFGRSRMRLAVIDFGDVVIFADEFGNVGKITKDKVEVPGRWGSRIRRVYLALHPLRGSEDFADVRRVEKTIREEDLLPLKRLVLEDHGTLLGYVVSLPHLPPD